MYKLEIYKKAADFIREKCSNIPKVLVVLGSGLGELFKDGEAVIKYSDIPGFPVSTAPSHKGELIITEKAFFMSGRFHYYEGYSFEEITFYIPVFKLLGVDTIVLTNAAGGVNTSFTPGDLMLITDQIKFSSDSPLRGINEFGNRFDDMGDLYSKRLRDIAKECSNLPLKEGVYFYMAGPTYETHAEIRAISVLGGDAVGMSTVHEAVMARHCGMEILGISCITNMAAGITGEPLSEAEVVENANKANNEFHNLLVKLIERVSR